METMYLLEFPTILKGGTKALITLAINDEWKLTKRMTIYNEDGTIKKVTKWGTTRRPMKEEFRNKDKAMFLLETLKQKFIENWKYK